MTSKEIVIKTHRNMGRADALALREKAVAGSLTDTQIIDSEEAIPDWSEKRDYTKAAAGTPVTHEGQVYGLLQPHNAAHYPGTTPATLPALWRVKHTTNPAKAKPWVQPTSTSDMYLVGECVVWVNDKTYRAVRDTSYSPAQYEEDWEEVTAE